MSQTPSFKESIIMGKTIDGMLSFGAFCAKMDKKEIFINSEFKPITDVSIKIKLFYKILNDYVNDLETDFTDATSKDVAEFINDYLLEMNLYNEPNFNKIKEKLDILINEESYDPKMCFKNILDYSISNGIFNREIEESR